jgi:hypothetical protein
VQLVALVQLAELAQPVELDVRAQQATLVLQVRWVIQATRVLKDRWGYQEKPQIRVQQVTRAQLVFKALVVKQQILGQLATQVPLGQRAQQATQVRRVLPQIQARLA